MSGQHNNNTTYSTADLLRYLDGRMERGELLALERAMIDDEMLADSIEGYRMMRETHSDEIILAKAYNLTNPVLPKKENEKKIAPVVPISRFRWLGYAAAASLVVAAGWWIFSISRPETILPSEINDLSNPAFVNADPADTGKTDNMPALADNPVAASQEQPSDKIVAEVPEERKKSGSAYDLAKLNQEETNLMPPVPVTTEENNLTAKNTENKLSDADQGKRVSRAAPAITSKEKTTIILNFIDSSKALPMAGWDYYREYLEGKFDFPHLEKAGIIEISLNAGGKITDVKVDAPMGDKEKAYIIQTIKAGPPWNNKAGNPSKAIIQFQ